MPTYKFGKDTLNFDSDKDAIDYAEHIGASEFTPISEQIIQKPKQIKETTISDIPDIAKDAIVDYVSKFKTGLFNEESKPVRDYVVENPGKTAAMVGSTFLAPEFSIPSVLAATALGSGGAAFDRKFIQKEQPNGKHKTTWDISTPLENVVDIAGEGVLGGLGQGFGSGLSKVASKISKYGPESAEYLAAVAKREQVGDDALTKFIDAGIINPTTKKYNLGKAKEAMVKENPLLHKNKISDEAAQQWASQYGDKTIAANRAPNPTPASLSDYISNKNVTHTLLGGVLGGVTHGVPGALTGLVAGGLVQPAADLVKVGISKGDVVIPRAARSLEELIAPSSVKKVVSVAPKLVGSVIKTKLLDKK